MGDGGGGADRAEGAGGVPADPVVLGVHHDPDPALDLDPHGEGDEQRLASGVELLGDGEGRRQHRRGRVAREQEVGVVEVEGVPGSAVDEGGGAGGRGAGAAHQAARPRALGLHQLRHEHVDEGLTAPGQGAAEPVEGAVPRHLHGLGGKIARLHRRPLPSQARRQRLSSPHRRRQ